MPAPASYISRTLTLIPSDTQSEIRKNTMSASSQYIYTHTHTRYPLLWIRFNFIPMFREIELFRN